MIVPVLKKRVDALGISVVTNADVQELVTDAAGRVTGVKATIKTKDLQTIPAKAVILAMGGFASNPELVKRFSPQWAGYPSTASVGAEGDGILMAEKLGAKLDNMALAGPQTVAYDTGHGAVSLTNVRYNGAILVGKTGKRFTNELGNTAVIGADIKKQEGVAFLIFDRTSVENAALMKKYEAQGYFVKADTLDELARKLGVDKTNLKATVERWHGFFDKKKDEDFGRTQSMFSRIGRAQCRRRGPQDGRIGDSGTLRRGRNRRPVRSGRLARDRHGSHRRARSPQGDRSEVKRDGAACDGAAP